MTDAGRRARCGYRCGDEGATGDRENARPRYACSGILGLVAAKLMKRSRAARRANGSSAWTAGAGSTTPTATVC
jgi:hypothetical protein